MIDQAKLPPDTRDNARSMAGRWGLANPIVTWLLGRGYGDLVALSPEEAQQGLDRRPRHCGRSMLVRAGYWLCPGPDHPPLHVKRGLQLQPMPAPPFKTWDVIAARSRSSMRGCPAMRGRRGIGWSTGRSGMPKGRRALDFYPTPAWMVDHLLDRLSLAIPPGAFDAGCRCDGADLIMSKRPEEPEWFEGPRHEPGCPGDRPPLILEPCVGEGWIVNAVNRRQQAQWFTNDLDPQHPADIHVDATDWRFWYDASVAVPRPMGIDWVITNPPFSDAFEIIRHAVDVARVGVAALLRVTWLEPPRDRAKARGLWLAEHPPKWELVMERFSFDGSGSVDSAPAAWFVWSPYLDPRIEVIPGRGRQLAFEGAK